MPTEKLQQRVPRIHSNLRAAIRDSPQVIVSNNDDLSQPFGKVAEFDHDRIVFRGSLAPRLAGPLERDPLMAH